MAVIKQKFRLRKHNFSLVMILTVVLLMIISGVAGFFFSDSGIINKVINRTSSECTQTYKAMQDFIKETNYWRNADQECEKKLWACEFLLKQASARASAISSNESLTRATNE